MPRTKFQETMRAIRRPILKMAGVIGLQTGLARTPDGRWFNVPRTMNPLDYTSIFRGLYEAAETKILQKHFFADDTIIEIGANIGVVSRFAFENKLKDGGKMYSAEANPHVIPTLSANLDRAREKTGNSRQIEIISAAIGSPKNEGQMARFNVRDNMTSGLAAVSSAKSKEVTVEVPIVSLSTLVGKYAPNGYSLISDCEGAEIVVIKEDGAALTSCRQIAIELHHPVLTGRPETPDDIVKKLVELGFTHVEKIEDTHYFRR